MSIGIKMVKSKSAKARLARNNWSESEVLCLSRLHEELLYFLF